MGQRTPALMSRSPASNQLFAKPTGDPATAYLSSSRNRSDRYPVAATPRGIHPRPKSGISFGSRNAAMISRRWPTGSPLLRHFENKTRSSGQRVEARALSSRIGNRAWSALKRRNRSLPFSPGISKSRTARSKAERSHRNRHRETKNTLIARNLPQVCQYVSLREDPLVRLIEHLQGDYRSRIRRMNPDDRCGIGEITPQKKPACRLQRAVSAGAFPATEITPGGQMRDERWNRKPQRTGETCGFRDNQSNPKANRSHRKDVNAGKTQKLKRSRMRLLKMRQASATHCVRHPLRNAPRCQTTVTVTVTTTFIYTFTGSIPCLRKLCFLKQHSGRS